MSDPKKYFTAARKKSIELPLTALGFKKYKTAFIGRMTDEGVFQFLNFEKSAHGGEQFTVDIAIRPMYCPNHSYLTLLPGNRLGAMATSGKNDIWWNYSTEDKALASFTEIARLVDEHVLAFFNATATSQGIIEAHEQNTFGDKVRWGTPGWGEYDLAHIYLHAGDQQKSLAQFDAAREKFSLDEREWAQSAAMDCQHMLALIGAGKTAIDHYVASQIAESKKKLKLSDW